MILEQLLLAIKHSLDCENWIAALVLSLTIPDICGKVDNPSLSSKARYMKWFDDYLRNKYSVQIGAPLEMLSNLPEDVKSDLSKLSVLKIMGSDCYALRCSLLHEGKFTVSDEHTAKIEIDEYIFTSPSHGASHFNKITSNAVTKVQLRVDYFCNDMTTAAKEWLKS